MQTEALTRVEVMIFLARAADLRCSTQKQVNELATRLERLQTRLSIKAINAKVIPTDKDGEFRIATNEADRKLAAKLICQRDKRYTSLEARLLEAQRQLQYLTDQQANYRFIAQLMAQDDVRPF